MLKIQPMDVPRVLRINRIYNTHAQKENDRLGLVSDSKIL